MLDIPACRVSLIKNCRNRITLVHNYQTIRIDRTHLGDQGAEILLAGCVFLNSYIQTFFFSLFHKVIIAGKSPVTVHTDDCDLLSA